MTKERRSHKDRIIDTKETAVRIFRALEAQGVAYEDVCTFLGIKSTKSVYRWLNGRRLPSTKNMADLAYLLGKDIEDLITYKYSDQMTREEWDR